MNDKSNEELLRLANAQVELEGQHVDVKSNVDILRAGRGEKSHNDVAKAIIERHKQTGDDDNTDA